MPEQDQILWVVMIGFFTVLGGVFTVYKFINMVLDRREAKITDEILRLETVMKSKADKSTLDGAIERVCDAVDAMGKQQKDFVKRMDKHVETFYDHHETHKEDMHKIELRLASERG